MDLDNSAYFGESTLPFSSKSENEKEKENRSLGKN